MHSVEVEKKEQLADIVSQDKVVLKFYKDNCSPCKIVGMSIEEASSNIKEDITIANVKLETVGEEVFFDFGIKGTPTLLLVEKGIEKKRHSGFISPDDFQEFVK